MPLFNKDELDARHASVRAAKINMHDAAKSKRARMTEVINRDTGAVTRVPQESTPATRVANFVAEHPVATAAVMFGLMAAVGPLRLIRLGLLAGRGIGMAMAVRKAAQGANSFT